MKKNCIANCLTKFLSNGFTGKKIICLLIFYFCVGVLIFAGEASEIIAECAKKSKAEDSIEYVEKKLKQVSVPAEKRALHIFLGMIQEQLGNFDFARENYAAAAGIAAGNASGVIKKSNEQLVLDAVRCALSLGDYALADSYLNSSVRNSESAEIQSYIVLYSLWSSLCKAKNALQIQESVVMLEAYTQRPSLSAVHPQMLLTLWYVTGSEKWAEQLKKSFPASAESAVVGGKIQLMPAPFWFFVPRSGVALPEIANEDVTFETLPGLQNVKDSEQSGKKSVLNEKSNLSEKNELSENNTENTENNSENAEKPVHLQLGLFREKENAQNLVARLKEKGFESHVLMEKRPSGTLYYIVVVDDTSEIMAEKLRSSGFDCYPVFN